MSLCFYLFCLTSTQHSVSHFLAELLLSRGRIALIAQHSALSTPHYFKRECGNYEKRGVQSRTPPNGCFSYFKYQEEAGKKSLDREPVKCRRESLWQSDVGNLSGKSTPYSGK